MQDVPRGLLSPMPRVSYWWVPVLLVVVSIGGCSSKDDGSASSSASGTDQTITVGCDSKVIDPDPSVAATAAADRLGPIRLLNLGERSALQPVGAGVYVVKALVLVDDGPPVTMSVGAKDHDRVGLLYGGQVIDESSQSRSPSQADHAVTFVSCGEERFTAYTGGIVVDGPGCVHLHAAWDEQESDLSIGVGQSSLSCQDTPA